MSVNATKVSVFSNPYLAPVRYTPVMDSSCNRRATMSLAVHNGRPEEPAEAIVYLMTKRIEGHRHGTRRRSPLRVKRREKISSKQISEQV
jgi:hypothetical protein